MTGLDHLANALGTARLAWRLSREAPREHAVERILVLGYAAIGDLLFFLPVVQALREKYPKAKITWLANAYPTTKELLPATGLVDEIWLHDWEGPRARAEQGGVNVRIMEARFDLAVLTLSSPAHYFQFGLASIPVRTGHLRRLEPGPAAGRVKRALVTGELARRAVLNRPVRLELAPEHALTRNLRLLEPLGLTAPFDARPALPLSGAPAARAEKELPGGPWIGVHLALPRGQYGKIWPPERFGRVCRELAKTAKARFVLLGAADEAESAAAAKKEFPGFVDLVGRLSLLESFAAIARCSLFLSSDTGLAKAAMALGVPTATWWGPSDVQEYGAIWDPGRHLDIRTGIWCSPCSRMGMPRLEGLNYLNCGPRDCLAKLDEDFALSRLRAKYGDLLGA